MSNTIHISTVKKILQSKEVVNLTVIKKNGEIITINDCIMTSQYTRGRTCKVIITESNEIRQIRFVCILKLNNQEVVL